MSEFETEAQAIAALAKEIEVVDAAGIPHAFIPPGHRLESLEHLLPAPTRIKESPKFYDVNGFAKYFHAFAEAGTAVFADDREYRFTTVFDCHAKGRPAHGDHSASLTYELSPEWKAWAAASGIRLNPSKFIDFLEDNSEYVVGEFNAGKLLSMCRDLRVVTRGQVDMKENLGEGTRDLVITQNGEVKGEGIAFPEEIELALRVFKNAAKFEFTARLRWYHTSDGIAFAYAINDIEGVKEQAFDVLIADVQEAIDQDVLKGAYKGAYHK